MSNGDSGSTSGGAPEPHTYASEESGGERSSPPKDLLAAIVIGAIAIAATWLAFLLPVPTRAATAPGLLPIVTGASLLAMALGLGAGAVRDGGARRPLATMRAAAARFFADSEERRTLALIAAIFVYVMLVGQISFDLRYPTRYFDLRFSSYETISIPALAVILRTFWQASLARCVVVALVMVVALASLFRNGFEILLPAGG